MQDELTAVMAANTHRRITDSAAFRAWLHKHTDEEREVLAQDTYAAALALSQEIAENLDKLTQRSLSAAAPLVHELKSSDRLIMEVPFEVSREEMQAIRDRIREKLGTAASRVTVTAGVKIKRKR